MYSGGEVKQMQTSVFHPYHQVKLNFRASIILCDEPTIQRDSSCLSFFVRSTSMLRNWLIAGILQSNKATGFGFHESNLCCASIEKLPSREEKSINLLSIHHPSGAGLGRMGKRAMPSNGRLLPINVIGQFHRETLSNVIKGRCLARREINSTSTSVDFGKPVSLRWNWIENGNGRDW